MPRFRYKTITTPQVCPLMGLPDTPKVECPLLRPFFFPTFGHGKQSP
jgi:hypothetical protein